MTRRRWIWTIATVVLVAAVSVALVNLRGIPGHTRPHQSIGAQAQTLRNAFNADIGKVRIVALVSPTCGACLRGAADLQQHLFDDISNPNLKGYIVWVPKLDGHEANVDQATHTVADTRAEHYWDGDSYLVHAYDKALSLGQDAWDIYLIYPPDARWDSTDPPTPAYWMTQLGGAEGPTLDPAAFADHTRALLH